MSASAQNLEAIQKAIVRHNGNCEFPILEIRMNPFEVDRLGWDEFRGIPIVGDSKSAPAASGWCATDSTTTTPPHLLPLAHARG